MIATVMCILTNFVIILCMPIFTSLTIYIYSLIYTVTSRNDIIKCRLLSVTFIVPHVTLLYIYIHTRTTVMQLVQKKGHLVISVKINVSNIYS